MPADTGVTNWPSTDNLDLPSDKTIPPTDAGSGHYVFVEWLRRVTGICRAIWTDLTQGMTHDLPMGSHKITGLADGTSVGDAVNRGQLDSIITGVKAPVRAATTANITLSGAQTIDGVSVVAGDRVLVKNQSTGAENGIYAAASGAWTRATDADASAEVKGGLTVWVNEGTTNGDSAWTLSTNDPIVIGSTSLTFTQSSGLGQVTAGAGLMKTGNVLNAVGNADGSIVANADDLQVGNGGVVALKATDSLVVHLAGTETITGAKAFTANLTITDVNVVLSTGTGTQIGTASGQKLGFLGATPVAQQANSVDLGVVLSNFGLRAAGGNPPLNLGSGALTAGASTLGATTATGLQVNGGNFQVDSSGRVGLARAPVTDAFLIVDAAHPGVATTAAGIRMQPAWPSTMTNQTSDYEGNIRTAAASFTLAASNVFRANAPSLGASSAVTTVNGYKAENQGQAGSTNAYGLNVAGQSGAGTLNVGVRIDASTTCALWLGGGGTATDVTGGIAFGSGRDVTCYRSGSNAYTINATSGVTLTGNLTLPDPGNLVLGTTTGTKIATATSQKLGFWNATPIVQPTTAVAAATFVANTSGIANDTATFDGYTIGQVVKALRNTGLLA